MKYDIFSASRELQFSEMENEQLKKQLLQTKIDLEVIKYNINNLFKEIECTFSGNLGDGGIRLTLEDRQMIMKFIDKELNKE